MNLLKTEPTDSTRIELASNPLQLEWNGASEAASQCNTYAVRNACWYFNGAYMGKVKGGRKEAMEAAQQHCNEATLHARVTELEDKCDELEAELAEAFIPKSNVSMIHKVRAVRNDLLDKLIEDYEFKMGGDHPAVINWLMSFKPPKAN